MQDHSLHRITSVIENALSSLYMGFPCGSAGKESACHAGDLGSIPGLGSFPGVGNGLPTSVSLPGEFHGQRSLVGYSPWGRTESDTTEQLRLSLFIIHAWSISLNSVPHKFLIVSFFCFILYPSNTPLIGWIPLTGLWLCFILSPAWSSLHSKLRIANFCSVIVFFSSVISGWCFLIVSLCWNHIRIACICTLYHSTNLSECLHDLPQGWIVVVLRPWPEQLFPWPWGVLAE